MFRIPSTYMYCILIQTVLPSYCNMMYYIIFFNSEFGGKVFSLKPIVKVLPKLFDHSDKNVREEVS